MFRHIRIIAATVALLAVALFGCGKGGDNAVIAKVNNAKITAADFKHQMEGLDNPQLQMSVAVDSKARKDFLEDLIGIELVVQEAKRLGLDKDPEFRKRQETMRKEMEQQIQSALRNDLFRELLKKELSDKLNKVPQPADKEIKEFYAKNQDKMMSMNGKRLTLKEVEPRLKDVLMQNKQRDIYLEYTKSLKAKAKVSVDDKALEAALAPATAPTGTLQLTAPSAVPAQKGDETKK